MKQILEDKQKIRELAESWVMFRDAADWESFKTIWLPSGTIDTLWYQGPWEGYLERSRESWGRGMSSVHYLCGSLVEIAADRAVCRSNMKMYGRGTLDDAAYDLDATAQFCDFVEKREGNWGLAYRCVIHVKDRIDPVDARNPIQLDATLLAQQPSHYRHLAYIHARAGRLVKKDMPGLAGPEADRLKALGRSWLAGDALRRPT